MAKSLRRPESLLATLPTELSHRLFAKARPLSLAASQTLFEAGDDGDGCYRVEEGLLKASVSVATGGERILAILGPGSVVGELSMIDSAPRSASVTALRDSKLSFVNRDTFEAFGQSTPELYRHITILLARRLRDTNEALVATNFLSVKGRVARALLSLAEAFGGDIGRAHPHSAESFPERPRRDGRHCAGECQPGPQRLGEPLIGEPSRGLLLPQEQGRPQP